MNCPIDTIQLMHKYLDEEITFEEEKQLRVHLDECKECSQHFHELKKSIALVQSTSHIEAPSDFTLKVMANLPKEKKTVSFNRWFKNHPVLTAASLFILLMTSSVFSLWNNDQNFSVTKQPNLVIENDKVIVPEGEVIEGNVTVKNGTIVIEGEIQGDLTIINGEKYLASAGAVTGEIKEVNELFDWLWFHMKNTVKDVVNVFDDGKVTE
ncbi:anti-sigma factor family protein [Litchfieldia salsa]|uniref:Transmembrane transcriptional regulator (Anti-sigma factor RsiW) n=1 Tax=Litchfieldia salsa TaxID=930152 RepID=A0A1H0WWU7_9BACI|nr:anti-sigma factor [Litchfieldia salsa]SDP95218.1 Transmembrane transcriptional regulator (anti-sigma factor RsiW) [Litchfieldia salsa]